MGVVGEGNREYLGWMKDGCCEGGKSRMFGLDVRWVCEGGKSRIFGLNKRWVLWGREIENVWVE